MSARKKAKPSAVQTELRFKRFKHRHRPQKLLGATKKFSSFFRFKEKTLAEQRFQDFVKFFELDRRGQKHRPVTAGYVNTTAFATVSAIPPSFKKFVGKRKYAFMSYRVLKPFKGEIELREGLRLQTIMSLEELARKKEIKVLFTRFPGFRNVEGRKELAKQGFRKFRKTNYWFKILK